MGRTKGTTLESTVIQPAAKESLSSAMLPKIKKRKKKASRWSAKEKKINRDRNWSKKNNIPGTEIWVVESVLCYKIEPRRDPSQPLRVYFFVLWEDYSLREATWETCENLQGCETLLRMFLAARDTGLCLERAADGELSVKEAEKLLGSVADCG